ncbi:TPA: hypothetical protein ACT79I_000004 [Staphylococcus aureus]|nr:MULTISPECIES: hypothetical protein [Staphylococcus]MCA2193738.1 hypothetical protein [Staphylococcus aureus]MCC9105927.1 hypothetical protein [Staphylococcus aureus]MCF7569973.1 hypothetical protein [Staphylococcus aureus]MCF7588985.1 hypothetical protein [Staphylococcus aureus]MCF7591156.1 hypothetical protein [Staphylococcus aureus]
MCGRFKKAVPKSISKNNQANNIPNNARKSPMKHSPIM